MDTKKRNRYTTESYVRLVKATNPHNLDYTEVVYVNQGVKIKLRCNDCGYEFQSRPLDVLHRGTGCKRCHNTRIASFGYNKIQTWDVILRKIKSIHGEEYLYDVNSYVSYNKKISITCLKHGIFYQTVGNHIQGQKCPACSRISGSEKRSLPVTTFIENSNKVHSGKYIYDTVNYLNLSSSIKITCPEHGPFFQVAQTHMAGHKCPSCAKVYSNQQRELNEFIKSLGVETEENYKLKNGKHLDIVCKNYPIAVEFNGLVWHSEQFKEDPNYHKEKTEQAKAEGFRLIHIFEDEWLRSKDRVCFFLSTVLGKNTTKRDARKLILDVNCPWGEVKNFLDTYHMQGACAATSICYGLRDPETRGLFCVMTFSTRDSSSGLELTRFCSNGIVRGGFTKLLYRAFEILKPTEIVSFSDNRLTDGAVYAKTGFKQVDEVPPRYWYTKNRQRFHRRGFQKQYLKVKFDNYDETKTEKENCQLNGYYRIWDCGKKKWSLTRK